MKKVLLVDDDLHIANLMKFFIEKHSKSEVTYVHNGKEALEVLKNEPHDLIILDYDMPVMDGVETATKIKEDTNIKNIPIVVSSSHVLETLKKKFKNTNVKHYFHKDDLFTKEGKDKFLKFLN